MPGEVHRLRLELGPDNVEYGVLAVVHQPEGLVVIFCQCKWDRRAYWEQEFKTLLDTVRIKT